MRRMKMAKMEKALWCPTLLIHHFMDTRRRRCTRPAPACCSWPLNGRKIYRVLRVSRFATKSFSSRSHGRLFSFSTPYNGVCHWNHQVALSSRSLNTAPTTTTTTHRRRTNKTKWDTAKEQLIKILCFLFHFHLQIAQDIRTLHDTLCRFKSILVDPAEFACLKAIVLFRSEAKGLKDATQIENLQDQAQVIKSSKREL